MNPSTEDHLRDCAYHGGSVMMTSRSAWEIIDLIDSLRQELLKSDETE